MNKLTHEEIIAALTTWSQINHRLKAGLDPLSPYLSIENPLHEGIWAMSQAYTDQVARSVGDEFGWLNWYQLENDMGAKGYGARYAGGDVLMREIRNPRDLAWLIAGGPE